MPAIGLIGTGTLLTIAGFILMPLSRLHGAVRRCGIHVRHDRPVARSDRRSLAPQARAVRSSASVSTGLDIGGASMPLLFGLLIDYGMHAWVFYSVGMLMLVALAAAGWPTWPPGVQNQPPQLPRNRQERRARQKLYSVQLFRSSCRREQLLEADRAADDHHAAMLALELARVVNTAGVRNHADLLDDIFHVILDPDRLVHGVEALLKPAIVGGDAGRAGVPVALQGLDAAKGEP